MASSVYQKIGAWSFLVGILVALILGALNSTAGSSWVVGLLLVLGLIVGLLNIHDREIIAFLIGCIAFLVAVPALGAAVSVFGTTFEWLTRMLAHVAIFVVPAAIITALKAIFALAGSR
jgi:hypothetical protein